MILPKLRHVLLARHRKGHGIHSPYLYHLITHTLFNKNRYYCFDSIEFLFPATKKEHALGQALFKLAEDISASTLVSCCVSDNVDLAYLMSVKDDAHLFCLTDTEQHSNDVRNVQAVVGGCRCETRLITDTDALNKQGYDLPDIDLAIFDPSMNTSRLLTLFELCLEHSHNGSLFVVKHIHDKQMEQCWNTICNHPKVTASLDVFQYGILLFNPNLEKKHYLIRQ